MTRALLKTGVLAAALAIGTLAPAAARPGVISVETYACISWGDAHQYTMQSLTPKGGQINRYCSIRLPKGTPVDVINEFDEGHAVVTHRGKTWWVDKRAREVKAGFGSLGSDAILRPNPPRGTLAFQPSRPYNSRAIGRWHGCRFSYAD